MKPKAAQITVGSAILLVAAAAVWLVALTAVIKWPPGPPAWYREPTAILTFVVFPLAPFVAARFWFSASAYFAFGALTSYPTAWLLFGPPFGSRLADSISVPIIVATIFAFCCLCGIAAAQLGSVARPHSLPNDRNA